MILFLLWNMCMLAVCLLLTIESVGFFDRLLLCVFSRLSYFFFHLLCNWRDHDRRWRLKRCLDYFHFRSRCRWRYRSRFGRNRRDYFWFYFDYFFMFNRFFFDFWLNCRISFPILFTLPNFLSKMIGPFRTTIILRIRLTSRFA